MATFESDDKARPDSLLKWVNTFGISVETFADLSSGTLLLECLQTMLPELSTASGNDPWKIIMKAFEDFYGGSLEKSISLKDIRSSSDQEQLARVVVLLLLIAVQRKPNEDMIAKITTLDFWTQRDIMYYIESGLGKAKSHTLVAGGFTSGIGDPLPDLEHHSFSFNLMQESPTSTDMTVTPTNSTTTACETFISDPIPTPTPLRRSSSHCLYPNRYYLGLESPAGLRWLQSPAITAMPGRSTSKKRVCPPDHGMATMEEEVLKLRHRVRVLERSLESETKFSQDLYTEVCQKTYCLEQLEVHCNQLESQVEKLAELHDLQDELQQCREKLLATERSLTRSRNEVDALQAYKAKCATLEAEADEFHCNSSKLSQYEQMVSDLDKKLLGISNEKRALELSHQTTMIKLQARNEEVERLMEQNRESLREVRELTLKCQTLQETHDEALLQLEEKSEGEQAALQEKRHLDVEIEKLQNLLEVKETAFSRLTLEGDKLAEEKSALHDQLTLSESQICELQTQFMAQESALSSLRLERDELAGEKAALLDKCSISESQLQNIKTQLKGQECTLSSLTFERDQLVETKTALQDRVASTESRIHELQTEVTELDQEKSALLDKFSASKSHLQDVEDRVASTESRILELQTEVTELDQEKSALLDKFSASKSHLQDVETQLQVRECTLFSLTLERDKLVEEKTALEERVTLSDSKIHELQSKLTELGQSTEEKAALLDQLKVEKAALFDKCSTLESQLQDVKTQLKVQTSTLASQTLERDKLVETKIALENRVTSSESKIHELQSKLTELDQSTEEKAALLDQLKTQLKVQTSTLASQTLERDKLVETKIALENRVTSSESKIHELQSKLTELDQSTEEKAALLDQLKVEKAALLDKCSTLGSQLQDVKTQLKVRMSTLASLTLERDKLVETKTALENRVTSSESKIRELQSELTELDQLTEEKAALLDKYSVSESQLQDVKAKYQQLARELKQTHKCYQSDLETLRDKNRELQLKQEESYADLCKENHAILKKQTKLHEEVEELRRMQGEMTALCQQYKEALEKNKKLLAKEQHHGAKLASENKSLEAQLGFASQKLRDMEKRKNSRAASPPSFSRQSSSVSSFAPHMLSSYELQTNEEEFYSQLQDEFDNTVGSIPFEFDDPPTYNCIAEDSFRSLSKPIMKTNPRRATLAVPSFSSSHWHSSLTAIREDEEENDGEDSSRVRISELKRRNAKALPHLKSSYPIEMQVQPESPNNSDDCVRNAIHKGEQKAPELNTNRSVDLQTTSKTAFLSTEAHSRKRTISSRKRAEEFPQPSFDPLTTSPLPTRRRTGAPPTPKDILARQLIQAQNSRHSTMTSTALKLREYLDHKPCNTLHDPKSTFDDPNPRRQSTVFEIAFSPPRVKRALPKRLQQQENTRVTLPKQPENKATKLSVPKATASMATVTKSRPAHSRRPVLKSKN